MSLNIKLNTLPMPEAFAEMDSGLIVPADYAQEPPKPLSMDLFAGCGGFGCGFVKAGFHVIAASEWWAVAAETYLCNLGSPQTVIHVGKTAAPDANKKDRAIHEKFGGRTVLAGELWESAGTGWIVSEEEHAEDQCGGYGDKPFPEAEKRKWFHETYCSAPPHRLPCEHFWMCDVRDLKGQEVLETLGIESDALDCVTGGPPCQGFSTAGKRQVMDTRNSLVFEFCRMIIELRPRTMVFENVPGMLNMVTPEGVNVVDAICLYLERGGYGTYDALRRSLVGMPEARGFVRQKQKHEGHHQVKEKPIGRDRIKKERSQLKLAI
jgi:DNA (cytosine-5)-methyltransferase 1